MNGMYTRNRVDYSQEKPMPEKPEKRTNLNKVGQMSYTAMLKALNILAEAHLNIISMTTGLSVEEAFLKLKESQNADTSNDKTVEKVPEN